MPPHPIEGKWQMIRAEMAGEQAPDLVVEKTEIEFRDGTYVVRFDGVESDRGSYELSGDFESSHIVLRSETCEYRDRLISSIYQLVGNRLRICYGLGNTGPVEFVTNPMNPHYLATYRRKA